MSSDCCPDGFCLKCQDIGYTGVIHLTDLKDPDKKHIVRFIGCKQIVEEVIGDMKVYFGALNRVPNAEVKENVE